MSEGLKYQTDIKYPSNFANWPSMWKSCFMDGVEAGRALTTDHSALVRKLVEALEKADKFCGRMTADVCSDAVHIPIQDALTKAKEAGF